MPSSPLIIRESLWALSVHHVLSLLPVFSGTVHCLPLLREQFLLCLPHLNHQALLIRIQLVLSLCLDGESGKPGNCFPKPSLASVTSGCRSLAPFPVRMGHGEAQIQEGVLFKHCQCIDVGGYFIFKICLYFPCPRPWYMAWGRQTSSEAYIFWVICDSLQM